MKQSATVVRVLDDGTAEVSVRRGTACGGNCASCGGCSESPESRVIAGNRIGALPGSRVVIESGTGAVMKAAVLIYLVPILLMVAAFAAAYLLGLSEGECVAVSFGALALSAAVLAVSDRFRKKLTYTITAFEDKEKT